MPGKSSKAYRVNFWLSNEAYNKILETINNPKNVRNQYDTVGSYCKAVCERHPFRHDARKYRKPLS